MCLSMYVRVVNLLTFFPRVGMSVVLIVKVRVQDLAKGMEFQLCLLVEFKVYHESDASTPHLEGLVGMDSGLTRLSQALSVGREESPGQLQCCM